MIKKYLPTSLLGRTILIILIPVLLLQITVSIVFLDRHWSEMTERLAYAVAGEMIAVSDLISEAPDNVERLEKIENIVQNTFKLEMRFEEGVRYQDVDLGTYEQSWLSNPFDRTEKELSRQLSERTDFEFTIINIPSQKRVMVDLYLDDGVLEFVIPEGRLFSSSSYIFLLWVIGLSVLLFTIAIAFMRNQIRPIYRLGVTAERLGRGIPVGKIKPSGAREVRQAAEAFMTMQDRINQFVDQRTTMLAAVSHDLRTPLTRMKLQLAMLDDNEDTQAMRTDIKDMEQMIEGYLAFTKGDGGEDMQRVSVAELFKQLHEDAKRLGLRVDAVNPPNETVFIWAKPQALKRVFDNILANSARYGSKTYLSCQVIDTELGSAVQFEIADNGEGVEDNLVGNLIKPFYRGESSRNKKTGGVGLGLAIAHDIITAHGGSLFFSKSKELGGLQVSVRLPL